MRCKLDTDHRQVKQNLKKK